MTKTAKQYDLQQQTQSAETFKARLDMDILTIRAQINQETTRLERLRNEITDIETQKRNLEAQRSSFVDEMTKQNAVIAEKQKASRETAEINEKEHQRLIALKNDLIQKKNEVDGTRNTLLLRKSEAEKAEADASNKKSCLESLKKQADARNAEADSKIKSLEKLISDSEALKNKNALDSLALTNQRNELERIRAKYEQLTRENEAILDRKEAENRALLEKAQTTTKESQLSVDRQYNDLEIYKKKLKYAELRLTKFANENKLDEKFKAIKQELGL